MKKFYCFHCQQDVEPHGFWKIRFCPKCRHFITDDGEGFYKVCDVCGANLPANASKCVRCSHIFAMENSMDKFGFNTYVVKNTWLSWLFVILTFVVSIIAAMGILYVSFYFVAAVLFLALILFLFNILRAWFRI